MGRGSSAINRTVLAYASDDSNLCNVQRDAVGVAPVLIGTQTGLNLFGWDFYNPNAVDVFVKFFDASAPPTVGADPVLLTVQVSALGTVFITGTETVARAINNLYVAVTTGYLDTDANAPVTPILSQIFYLNTP